MEAKESKFNSTSAIVLALSSAPNWIDNGAKLVERCARDALNQVGRTCVKVDVGTADESITSFAQHEGRSAEGIKLAIGLQKAGII